MFTLPSVPERAANTFKANTPSLKRKLNVTGGAAPRTHPLYARERRARQSPESAEEGQA